MIYVLRHSESRALSINMAQLWLKTGYFLRLTYSLSSNITLIRKQTCPKTFSFSQGRWESRQIVNTKK